MKFRRVVYARGPQAIATLHPHVWVQVWFAKIKAKKGKLGWERSGLRPGVGSSGWVQGAALEEKAAIPLGRLAGLAIGWKRQPT
jgi:hypothetical protein